MTIRRLFVANRGEIAVRVIRTAKEVGVETVVGVSTADRDSMAARMADRAVVLGPPHASESYLRVPTVVQAAVGTDCDAVHPGYGFLSENPALVEAAEDNGLTFVGPPADVISRAGDKLEARSVAEQAGLPVVPGREVQSLAEAETFAQEAGFPVLLKAAGGGGGRGIKLADDIDELRRLFGMAQAEAGAAFGDSRLYVERFIRAARHVEVQIAADAHGAVVHLGERDCSTQRRYQKVVEEAPAPALRPELRDALRDAGVEFARAIGYRNLGTVEFIVDVETEAYFFLEMNCRIQVEHPVTEIVCGMDLVALQLRIADGEPLGFTQDEVELTGHAVECRLVAENPARGFAPSPGLIRRFEVPELANLRVDTHCTAGAAIPPYYDSLVAKVIASGATRDEALATMAEALDGLHVEGVDTNRDLLATIVRHDRFVAADLTTKWLEEMLA